MNIEEEKNNYAKKYGYSSWAQLRNCFSMSPFEMGVHENNIIKYCIKLNLKH